MKYFPVKYRTTNHRLPIEQGRIDNVEKVVKLCRGCLLQYIGDAYHYFCICPKFEAARKKLLPKNIWVTVADPRGGQGGPEPPTSEWKI